MKKINQSGNLEEIENFLLDASRPLTAKELKDALSNIPDDAPILVGGVGSAWITGFSFSSEKNEFELLREV